MTSPKFMSRFDRANRGIEEIKAFHTFQTRGNYWLHVYPYKERTVATFKGVYMCICVSVQGIYAIHMDMKSIQVYQ